MQTAVYDQIGRTYDISRRADPGITAKLIGHLEPSNGGRYLDVGCGSGNYTQALFQTGLDITGLDLSQEMLGKAKKKNPAISWVRGDARAMPFAASSFSGATCVLATHHIGDIEAAFQEVYRVLSNGKFVILTALPEQMHSYWINAYFPKAMEQSISLVANETRLTNALEASHFRNVLFDRWTVPIDLQDWFLQAGKDRPEIYLDPQVRAGISTFALARDQQEIALGCDQLRQDIETGKIWEVIASYESDLQDYVFVTAEKG